MNFILSLLSNEMIDKCTQYVIYWYVIYFPAADKDIRESLHESFNLTPVLVDIIKHTCSSAVNSLCMEVSMHRCMYSSPVSKYMYLYIVLVYILKFIRAWYNVLCVKFSPLIFYIKMIETCLVKYFEILKVL